MKRPLVTVVLALALAAITGITVSHFLGKKLSDAQQAVVEANILADVAEQRTEHTLLTLTSVAAQRDSARADAQSLAERATRREAALRYRIVRATNDNRAPELDSALAVIDDWHAAYDSITVAAIKSDSIELALRASLADQSAALARLRVAAGELVEARRPFLLKFIPEVGVGGAFGISATTRRPDAVIGITLTWRP